MCRNKKFCERVGLFRLVSHLKRSDLRRLDCLRTSAPLWPHKNQYYSNHKNSLCDLMHGKAMQTGPKKYASGIFLLLGKKRTRPISQNRVWASARCTKQLLIKLVPPPPQNKKNLNQETPPRVSSRANAYSILCAYTTSKQSTGLFCRR